MSSMELAILGVLVLAFVAFLWFLWAWLRLRSRGQDPPETAYTRGLSSLIGGDRREALRSLKEAVQHDSENLDAYIRMGDLLRESGETAKALAVHRDLTVRPRLADADRARILESLTRDYLAAGRFEEAGQSAERLRQIDRHHRFAHEALQLVAEALEDWPRAVQVVDERAKLAGEGSRDLRASYRVKVGVRLLAAGETREARKRFEEAIKLDAECHTAYVHLGDLDYGEGHSAKAVEHWKTMALKDPTRAAQVFERLERAYFELGQFGEVVSFYRELLHRSPREHAGPALLALAEIHRRKGDLSEAETFVQEALEIDPEDVHAHRHLVKLALDRGDAETALARLDRLLDTLDHGDQAFESVPVPVHGSGADR